MEQNVYDLNDKLNYINNIKDNDAEKFNAIISWAGEMMDLTIKERYSKVFPNKGEIWTCILGENVGTEINKTRPVIIISNNSLNKTSPLVTVIPITHKDMKQPSQYQLRAEDFIYKESSISGTVIAEQIKSVSKARFGRKIGELNKNALDNVQFCVLSALGIMENEEKHVTV